MQKLLDLRLACNTSDDHLLENVKSACGRPLSWIQEVDAHDRIAVLIGGGPSLADHASCIELGLLAEKGAVFFALGNSAKWLRENDYPVHFQVILDARPGNAEFVADNLAHGYLIASQCDPSVFDAVEPRNVFLWHSYMDGIGEAIAQAVPPPRQKHALIVGHHTVGLTALNLAFAMGYRTIHLFGYDSSSRDASGHAFPQTLGVGHAEMEVTAGGTSFTGQPAMIGQAERFPKVASELANLGCEIFVHGDGLLPTIARLMNAAPPERWVAECDLGKIPSRWDFLNWLAIVDMDRRAHGVGELAVRFKLGPNDGFRADGLPETIEQRKEMLQRVLRPLLPMIGATETHDEPDLTCSDYLIAGIVERYNKGIDLPSLEPSWLATNWVNQFLGQHERPIVITLREAPHWPARNSNIEAWIRFARCCGHPVVFVRDTAKAGEDVAGFRTCHKAAEDIHVRLALYKRALLNLFVANGPCELALLSSDIPYLMFKLVAKDWGNCGTPEFIEATVGLRVGEQFPWASPLQRIVWADDDLEAIQSAFTTWVRAFHAHTDLPLTAA